MASQIKVICRVRPALQHEGSDSLVTFSSDDQTVSLADPAGSKTHSFRFNRCYGPSSSTADVYSGELREFVSGLWEGMKLTVFAYGPSGSGKTHTMNGSKDAPGIALQALRDVFDRATELRRMKGDEITISISYAELLESLTDLLAEGKVVSKNSLPIRQRLAPFEVRLSEHSVSSYDEFLSIYMKGSLRRSTAATRVNATSSRSHSILTVTVRNQTSTTFTKGVLRLIDLAGSESNKQTGNVGDRLRESCAINTSLLVLQQVVQAINKGSRPPFRDSKLTELLQDALGGDSPALMICNISSSAACYRDTLNTLTFGVKTRKVENTPTLDQHAALSPIKKSVAMPMIRGQSSKTPLRFPTPSLDPSVHPSDPLTPPTSLKTAIPPAPTSDLNHSLNFEEMLKERVAEEVANWKVKMDAMFQEGLDTMQRKMQATIGEEKENSLKVKAFSTVKSKETLEKANNKSKRKELFEACLRQGQRLEKGVDEASLRAALNAYVRAVNLSVNQANPVLQAQIVSLKGRLAKLEKENKGKRLSPKEDWSRTPLSPLSMASNGLKVKSRAREKRETTFIDLTQSDSDDSLYVVVEKKKEKPKRASLSAEERSRMEGILLLFFNSKKTKELQQLNGIGKTIAKRIVDTVRGVGSINSCSDSGLKAHELESVIASNLHLLNDEWGF